MASETIIRLERSFFDCEAGLLTPPQAREEESLIGRILSPTDRLL